MEIILDRAIPVYEIDEKKEDKLSHLNVLIRVDSKRNIEIQLTDETRLFFLYSLIISDNEFQTLKKQQNLLRDWIAFPGDLKELFESCIPKDNEHKCTLDITKNILTIEQYTKMKWIEQIYLQVRPANDATLKAYLKDRVAEFKVTEPIGV